MRVLKVIKEPLIVWAWGTGRPGTMPQVPAALICVEWERGIQVKED